MGRYICIIIIIIVIIAFQYNIFLFNIGYEMWFYLL